ncbi:uncharacterized protein LOC144444678 isoform X2 [Glandiceps talaboti]
MATTANPAAPTLNWEHALFLGNINRELETLDVKDQILQLLLFLGVTLNDGDLEIRYSKNSETYIAFVNLGRRDVQKYVYDSLLKDGTRLADALVQDGRRLKVDYYRKMKDDSNDTTVGSSQDQDQGQGQSDIQGQGQDVSLEIMGHSIQLESRSTSHQSSNLGHVARHGTGDNTNVQQVIGQGHDPVQGHNTIQQHPVQVQGWMQGVNSNQTMNSSREEESNTNISSQRPGNADRFVVAMPTQNLDFQDDLELSPTTRMRRRRKKKLSRINQQQFESTDSDSDEEDRQSTGTFVVEEEHSFLNNTYTLDDEQSYLHNAASRNTTQSQTYSIASTSTSRPPSRLPRLKTRPSRTETISATRKPSPKTYEYTPKPTLPPQSLVPKRSVSPTKRPPTRAKKSRNTNEESFSVGQKLGNENRHLEFKTGGGEYLKKILKEHVGKYICAFLNSEGGSFMIGVGDDGTVHGVHCDQLKEDRVRRDIDSVIRNFKPQVFPEMYTVNFIPVRNQRLGPLKVVKITVKEGLSETLYENSKGEVYLRRDGGIQGPLKAHEIKEWCRMTYNKELDVLKNREKELEEELELQRQVESKLRMDLTKSQKNSKVCAIL